MFSLIRLPAQIIGFLESNVSPNEVAGGVCLAMFLGFVPLNGTMSLLLAIFFFIFKINRIAALLTLPIFKFIYILGASKITDLAGTHILENIDILTGFWRWVTNLPVIAYLDINNTLIAGGFAVSAVLSLPVFLVSRKANVVLKARYSEQMKSSGIAKLISRIKVASSVSGMLGPDAGTTLKNVGNTVKKTAISGLKSALSKSKTAKKELSGFRRVNIAGIALVIVILAVFHFGVGLFLSPALTSFIVDKVNESCGTAISSGRFNLWPLTLSCSIKDLKVFDPEDREMRIAKVDDGSVSISLLGILSRRLVLSDIHLYGAEINVEGSADGAFNIQRLSTSKMAQDKAGPDRAWSAVMKKKDWFGKAYEFIKKRFSRKDPQEVKEARNRSKKVARSVTELPRGRLVRFSAEKDSYLFEIKKFDIDRAYISIKSGGESLEISDAKIRLERLAFDPENGTNIGLFRIRGDIKRAGNMAGGIDIFFSKGMDRNGENAKARVELKDIDLDAVRFVYRDSLPVDIVKGRLTLSSNTSIENGDIDSRNFFSISSHRLEPKSGGGMMVGVVPVRVIIDALNALDPVSLKFDITGPVGKPEFAGFQESLMTLIKPYIGNIQENLKREGMNALGKFLQKTMKPEN